LTKAKK